MNETNYLQPLIDFFKEPTALNFQNEFMSGIILVVLIALVYLAIRVLIKLIFAKKTRRRCHGVNIYSEHGQLYITSNAIADLIKSMKSTFTHIDINRVDICSDNGSYILNIQISFDMGGGELTTQIQQLRVKIIADLKSIFGIEAVSEINVRLRKTSRPALKSGSQQPILTPAPAPIAEIQPEPQDETIILSDKSEPDTKSATYEDEQSDA